MKHLRRCFHCKKMVTIDPDTRDYEEAYKAMGMAECDEHLFPVFLCSLQCAQAHVKEHEEGGVVK